MNLILGIFSPNLIIFRVQNVCSWQNFQNHILISLILGILYLLVMFACQLKRSAGNYLMQAFFNTWSKVCMKKIALGLVLAGFFMAELKTRIIPTLWNVGKVCWWYNCYVKNIIALIQYYQNLHLNVQLTYEVEESKLQHLDVLSVRNRNSITSTFYRKPANNNIF